MSQPMEVPNPGSALNDPQCKVAFIYYVSTFRVRLSKNGPKRSNNVQRSSKMAKKSEIVQKMTKQSPSNG